MTHAEKRMLVETAAKVAKLDKQMELMTGAMEEFTLAIMALKPRRGRPPKPTLTVIEN